MGSESRTPPLTIDDILAFADRLDRENLRETPRGGGGPFPRHDRVGCSRTEAREALLRLAGALAIRERGDKVAMPSMVFTWGTGPACEDTDRLREELTRLASENMTVFPVGSTVCCSPAPPVKPAVSIDPHSDGVIEAEVREMEEAGAKHAFFYNNIMIPVQEPTTAPREIRKTDEPWPHAEIEIDARGKPATPLPGGYTIAGPHPDPALAALRAARTAVQGLPPGHRARMEEVCGTSSHMCCCGLHKSMDDQYGREAISEGVGFARECVSVLPADIRQSMQPTCHASGGPCWSGLCEANSGPREINQENDS